MQDRLIAKLCLINMINCKTTHYITGNYYKENIQILGSLKMLDLMYLNRIMMRMTTDHEVAGSIPGTSTNFKCGLGLERGAPSLVRTIG